MPIPASKRRSSTVAAVTLAAVAAAALTAGAANAETTGDNTAEATAAAACTIASLALPSGTNTSEVTGMSDDGTVLTYIAHSAATPNNTRAFVRTGGQSTEASLPGTGDSLVDVNSSGRAVGWARDSTGVHRLAYAWEDGVSTRLSTTGWGWATAINEQGVIVGTDANRAVYWPAGSTSPVALPLPADATGSGAAEIDEQGTIIGHIEFGWEYAWLTKPYVWHPDGTFEELTGPTDLGEEELLEESGVSGDVAVGYVGGLGNSDTGLRWDLNAPGTYEEIPFTRVNDVNAAGTIAGNTGRDAAYLTAADALTVLPGLTATGYEEAVEISESGRFLSGYATYGTDSAGRVLSRAVTWTCA